MYYEIVKRTIDILGSTFLIIIFCPLMFISAILIKLTSPGPMFADIPQRVGKNGKMFRLYKFRSMIVNAHEQIRTDPKFSKLYKEYKSSGLSENIPSTKCLNLLMF